MRTVQKHQNYLQLAQSAAEGDDDAAENTAAWGSLGFMFMLGVLSFVDAKPRNASVLDYEERDELRLADFIQHPRFVRGELRYEADSIRGLRIRTRIAVRSDGTVNLETVGRVKAALRRLEQLRGQSLMQLVGR